MAFLRCILNKTEWIHRQILLVGKVDAARLSLSNKSALLLNQF